MMMNAVDKNRVINFLKENPVKNEEELRALNWNFISATQLLPDDWEDLGTKIIGINVENGKVTSLTFRETVNILGCGCDYDDYECILDDPIPLK